MKTKVKLPDGLKKKKNKVRRQPKATKCSKRKNPKDLLQREVEKEIRKKIEQDARNSSNS